MISHSPKPLQIKSRFPWRKRVTFIVGFKCFDGLVLCADSLEEDGYTKRLVNKLNAATIAEEWGIGIGCAGTGAGITKFMAKLRELIGNGSYDRYHTEAVIEATLKHMQEQYPQEGIELIGALWGPNETHMYRTYRDSHCLSVMGLGFVCAGMDLSLPDVVLDSIFDELMGVDEAVRLGIFVTAIMKDKVDGCGGPTRVLIYKKGHEGWRHLEDQEVAAIECEFPMTEVYGMIYQYWQAKR
jgi:20S proteasome alpha/beta subunit